MNDKNDEYFRLQAMHDHDVLVETALGVKGLEDKVDCLVTCVKGDANVPGLLHRVSTLERRHKALLGFLAIALPILALVIMWIADKIYF